MLLPQEIIRLKRDNQVLDEQVIKQFVAGLADGGFSDAQAGAMAMAIYHQGLNTQETITLTQCMRDSGTVLTWDDVDKPIIDKHSTGGVGDKVSFMLAAIVAACGAAVPMISGRGLGHTGGTADKLESIANFNVMPSISQFKQLVKDIGVSIISQTNDLAPADKRLYGIRDVTATVESIPLITASILSKKLAAGLDVLTMDVKVGNGAMMNNIADARALAKSIVNVATGAGVKTQAIITDMNQVLGDSAGNALEMAETADYLTGVYRDPRLHQVVCALAKSMLIHGQLAKDEDDAHKQVDRALCTGLAAERFDKMVHAMQGPSNFIEQPWKHMQQANVIKDIVAPRSGYIANVDTRAIGMAVVALGGGRQFPGQAIDHSVGFDRIAPLSEYLEKGSVIARVHAANEDMAMQAVNAYLNAIELCDRAVEPSPVIYEYI
ncbi:thymidine phosphorylase [Thalassotalea agarivorans]|uniref:Thymidine phosphorylase n=1 Tax=Thalassotalea agarivorans TaxID=349064 RepID=A0A1I0DDH8_THASX|nr:thymidine phosphorylase [Thalassotalea agarivorans]SET30284.1 thymidine phosphorylase [Thalassotalea agarivorans]